MSITLSLGVYLRIHVEALLCKPMSDLINSKKRNIEHTYQMIAIVHFIQIRHSSIAAVSKRVDISDTRDVVVA